MSAPDPGGATWSPSRRGWTRRRLLGSAAAAGAWAAIGVPSPGAEPSQLHSSQLRLGWWAGAGTGPGYAQGFELGVEEAERLVGLLGGSLAVQRADGALAQAIPRLAAAGASVVIAAAAPRDLETVAAPGRTVVLAIAPGEEDRSVSGVLRVGWPRSWRESALAANASAAAAPRVVVDWHPGLQRYGAGQLNDRFTRRFASPMREEAWRGWIAVKAAAEALARAGSSGDPTPALRTLVLDGHHGTPLRFSRSGLLLHPAYLAGGPDDGEVEATLPVPEDE